MSGYGRQQIEDRRREGQVATEVQADRAQVMAYRMRALGLAERSTARPGDLPLLDLGVQEYTPGSAQVALAARTSADLTDDRLLMVWAARGAPACSATDRSGPRA